MAIDNPQAVRFCNEFARTRADSLAQTYYRIKQMLDEWDALDLATLIPNDPAEVVVDGSATDGRSPITGQMVHQLVESYARPWAADLDASDGLKRAILLRISVNPER